MKTVEPAGIATFAAVLSGATGGLGGFIEGGGSFLIVAGLGDSVFIPRVGASIIARITESGTPAALSCCSWAGEVSNLQMLVFIFAMSTLGGRPALFMSKISVCM